MVSRRQKWQKRVFALSKDYECHNLCYIYIFDRPRLLTTPSGDNDYTGGCTKHKTNGTYISAVFSDCML